MPTIAKPLSGNKNSVYAFLKLYFEDGFDGLCRLAARPKPIRLTKDQELSFKQTLLSKVPFECGLEGNLRTGELLRQSIKEKFAVDNKIGIYDLPDRLQLSYQKAHSDYQYASKKLARRVRQSRSELRRLFSFARRRADWEKQQTESD